MENPEIEMCILPIRGPRMFRKEQQLWTQLDTGYEHEMCWDDILCHCHAVRKKFLETD